jgi:F0F1-type ATP synthase membrane subunit c/vacuolar-type H+-ATPase subunit K
MKEKVTETGNRTFKIAIIILAIVEALAMIPLIWKVIDR